MTAFEIMLGMISSEVMGNDFSIDSAELTDEKLSELYAISKTYDMTHIVGSALKKTEADLNLSLVAPFYNEHTLAVFRYRRLQDELDQITDAFEKAGIDNIPLKGSVLRAYYPEQWMRTSCDIDVLVKKESLDSACAILESELGYEYMTGCSHDVSYESPTGVHLELHFVLLEEDGHLSGYADVLSDVWERSIPDEGKKHTRKMADGDFYFYHLAHMAKHFLSGGCGIKPFVDLWILDNKVLGDIKDREELIERGGLSGFLNASRRLVDVWFFSGECDDNIRVFEKYIVHGGNYGTVENSVNIGVGRKQGRFAYVLSRIFPPYKSMLLMYPSLEKKKLLLPFYHIRRWFRIVFSGGTKKAIAQFSKSSKISKEEVSEMASLVNYLGLDE